MSGWGQQVATFKSVRGGVEKRISGINGLSFEWRVCGKYLTQTAQVGQQGFVLKYWTLTQFSRDPRTQAGAELSGFVSAGGVEGWWTLIIILLCQIIYFSFLNQDFISQGFIVYIKTSFGLISFNIPFLWINTTQKSRFEVISVF